MRVDQGKVAASLRGFHEDSRVPRAVAEVRVQGFDKGHKARSTSSTNVLHVPRRLKSHRSSKLRAQIALLMGGTLSKTEINAFFLRTFTVLSLAHFLRQRESFVTNSLCSRANAWHY